VKHFILPELVDRATYAREGEDGWKLFHPNILEALDGVREFFGVPVTVNNWWKGIGNLQYRGYRPHDCLVGASQSYHKRGMAFDFDVKGFTADVARGMILEHQDDPLLAKIQRMEDGVLWVHADIGTIPKGKNRIYLFKA
jgi:hypothetical protein